MQKSVINWKKTVENKKKWRKFHPRKCDMEWFPTHELAHLVQETTCWNRWHPQKCAIPQHKGHQDLHTQYHLHPIGSNPEGLVFLSQWKVIRLVRLEVPYGRGGHCLARGAAHHPTDFINYENKWSREQNQKYQHLILVTCRKNLNIPNTQKGSNLCPTLPIKCWLNLTLGPMAMGHTEQLLSNTLDTTFIRKFEEPYMMQSKIISNLYLKRSIRIRQIM